MNSLEKIETAERRIKELRLLINHWKIGENKSQTCLTHIIEEINNKQNILAA